MGRTTRKDLRKEIQIGQIAEDAEKQWRKEQSGKQSITQRLLWSVPFLMIILFAVFYAISAPHTAGFVNLITPGAGWFAPIGFEFGVLILAIFVEAENGTRAETKRMLLVMLAVNVLINFAGATTSILYTMTSAPDTASLSALLSSVRMMTTFELMSNMSILPAYEQVALLVGFIVGPFTPFMMKFTGEYLVKMAMGRVVLRAENLEDKWLKARNSILYQALFRAALKAGAGNRTAQQLAISIAENYYALDYTEDDENEDAIGVPMQSTGGMIGATAHHKPMGFAPEYPVSRVSNLSAPIEKTGNGQQIRTVDSHGASRTRPKMSSKLVKDWMYQKPSAWVSVTQGCETKRDKSRAISEHLTGDDSGYKTVERVFNSLNIDL